MTTTATTIMPPEGALLAYLATAGKKPRSMRDVRKRIGDWLPGPPEEFVAVLRVAGSIEEKSLAVTAAGREALATFLGIASIPEKFAWDKCQATFLAPMALGIEAPSGDARAKLATADGFRAAVLAREYDLPTPTGASLREVANALAWKQLGVESTKRISTTSILSLLLGRLAGVDDSLEVDWRSRVAQLVAIATRAKNNDASAARSAILRRWLLDASIDAPAKASAGAASPAPTWTPAVVPTAAPERMEIELEEFALLVESLARRATTGRFGDHKVFISHVWRMYEEQALSPKLTEATFKTLLVQAFEKRLLTLSRADLVQLMDTVDVRESETTLGDYRFHFVTLPAGVTN